MLDWEGLKEKLVDDLQLFKTGQSEQQEQRAFCPKEACLPNRVCRHNTAVGILNTWFHPWQNIAFPVLNPQAKSEPTKSEVPHRDLR